MDFLYSVYFKSSEKEICQRLAHELTTRGHRVVACLQHAKILLIELTDGRTIVVGIIGQLAIVRQHRKHNHVSRPRPVRLPPRLVDGRSHEGASNEQAEETQPRRKRRPPAHLTTRPAQVGSDMADRLPAIGRRPRHARRAGRILRGLGRWTGRRGKVNELGAVVKSPAGFAVPNPYLAVASGRQRQMRQWATGFGGDNVGMSWKHNRQDDPRQVRRKEGQGAGPQRRGIGNRSRHCQQVARVGQPSTPRTVVASHSKPSLKTYFPAAFPLPFCPDHVRAIGKLEQAFQRGGLFALAMPRASGKTHHRCPRRLVGACSTGTGNSLALWGQPTPRPGHCWRRSRRNWFSTNCWRRTSPRFVIRSVA